MKVLFIYNPHSGKIALKNHIWDILNTFSVANYDLTVKACNLGVDIAKYVNDVCADYDLIICSGGDGTLNRVINGIVKKDKIVPVGYIPSGSTNDYASSLKLPKTMEKCADAITKGQIYKYDIGKFNEDYFIYVAAFGLFSEVSYATDQNIKNVIGHAAYIVEGIKSLTDVKTYHLKVKSDNEEFEDDFIFGMISNTTSVGGVYDMSKQDVKLDDGLFEVLLVKKPNSILDLNKLGMYFLGNQESNKYIKHFKCKEIEIIPDQEMPWSLDGEYGGLPTDVNIKVCYQKIQIVK